MREIPHLEGESSPTMAGVYPCFLCHISHKIITLRQDNKPKAECNCSDERSGGDKLPEAN
jgi:hypothetical protein